MPTVPSGAEPDRPQAVLDLAERCRRRERPLSALVVALATAAFLGTYLAAPLLPAVAVAAVLFVVARAPVLRPGGTVRLRTDDDVETVAAAFGGPTPPVLGLQWSIAETVTTADGVATYDVAYLFGLRSVEVTVDTRTETALDGGRLVESEVTVAGRPWATYTSTVRPADGHTTVEVTYVSDRRFGLRRVPQRLVARRYRDEVLAAQGYTTVERERDSRL